MSRHILTKILNGKVQCVAKYRRFPDYLILGEAVYREVLGELYRQGQIAGPFKSLYQMPVRVERTPDETTITYGYNCVIEEKQ